MNFDPAFYNTILQSAHSFLQQNISRVGNQFAQGFMDDFQGNQQSAQKLFSYVGQEALRLNGSPQLHGEAQLFQIVGTFISDVFNLWRQKQNSQPNTFGFAPQNTGFGNNGSVFSQGRSPGFGMNRRPEASAHLADDISDVRPASQSTFATTPQTFAQTPTPVASAAPTMMSMTQYVDNPLDNIPETGIEFINNTSHPNWNGDQPKDNRIVLGARTEVKTRDARFTVQSGIAFHQLILDDPMQVMRDFFEIVPDSVLGSVFFYTVNYNHLDVIDVPTEDFLDIRRKCQEARQSDRGVPLHKQLIEKLKTMQYGPYRALTKYLVDHINRALYLACRLSSDPQIFIAIDEFDDLNDLLSSSFRHPVTVEPNGRYVLETIVGNAIWNALVKNVGVMFEDNDIPTHAIQSSPAFPYSIEGVYPNKFSVPTSQDQDAEKFMDAMREHELSRRTYLLSRRRVIVTNVLGKKVLPEIGTKPKMLTTTVAPIFEINNSMIPFADDRQINLHNRFAVKPLVSENYPTEQFDEYHSDPKHGLVREVEKYGSMEPVTLPLDQTIFAIQYGVDPLKYMAVIDTFSLIDKPQGQNRLVLATKSLPMLKQTI